jgi:LPS-assembly lipoprotein
MWSSKSLFKLVTCTLLALSLAGCFRPLNGQFGKDNAFMASELALVDVEPMADNLGHYLVQNVLFELNGGKIPEKPRYKLTMKATNALMTPVIDSSSGRADVGSVITSVKFTLTRTDNGKEIGNGVVNSSATFDRMSQRFSAARARRDAEIRVSQAMAEDIRTRVATMLLNQK